MNHLMNTSASKIEKWELKDCFKDVGINLQLSRLPQIEDIYKEKLKEILKEKDTTRLKEKGLSKDKPKTIRRVRESLQSKYRDGS